jgi:hypothetical protein
VIAMNFRICMLAFLALATIGCAGRYEVVQLPQREADLYPLSQGKKQVTVAVDEISTPGRARRYFGANLIREGVWPVAVVVSNYGDDRVVVKPSDVLLHRGNEIIDPLPLETVLSRAKEQHGFLRSRTQQEVKRYFERLAFRETSLAPGQTYQGIMFFPAPPRKEGRGTRSLFSMLSLFREGGPAVRVGVTNLDTRERLHYGPFSLTAYEGFSN